LFGGSPSESLKALDFSLLGRRPSSPAIDLAPLLQHFSHAHIKKGG
jgi:hypothetical protein